MIYRQAHLACPHCRRPLEERNVLGRSFHACAACEGLFVSEHLVRDMFHEMAPGHVVDLSPRSDDEAPRPCAECGEAMLPASLAGVDVDHCATHGIWFDREELEIALRREEEGRQRIALQPSPPVALPSPPVALPSPPVALPSPPGALRSPPVVEPSPPVGPSPPPPLHSAGQKVALGVEAVLEFIFKLFVGSRIDH
jgi:Zn-finger nucleic acid-binding protein